MRLIDWDKVLEWMHRQKETTEQWSMRIAIENYVDDMPTVEAEPRRHGRWVKPSPKGIVTYDEHAYAECSVCHKAEYLGYGMAYCPTCGAKMDEVKDND